VSVRRRRVVSQLEVEALYWGRPPEQIWADRNRHPSEDTIAKLQAAAFTAQRQLDELPEDEREIADLFPGALLDLWRGADAAERQGLLDAAVARAIADEGAAGFRLPAVQRHLETLVEQMRSGRLEDRRQARDRWRYVTQSSEPSFREIKEAAGPVEAALAYDAALKQIGPIRRRARGRWTRAKQDELAAQLRSAFPGWPQASVARMADVLELQHHDPQGVRLTLLDVLGSEVGRAPGTMKDLVAKGRSILTLRRQIEEGRGRFNAWLMEQGLQPA
jgi:hypothetical protein